MPFYQPLAALELFERALARKDIATGKHSVKSHGGYKTHGTPTSDYREGNSTVVMEVLPSDATYNTTLNGPNPSSSTKARRDNVQGRSERKAKAVRKVRRSMGGRRLV